MADKEIKTIAQNRKARHEYFIDETYEAGIELKGSEVKSIRLGKCDLKDSYVQIEKRELIAFDMHISPYEKGSYYNTDPLRPKRLLMHKSEILKLEQRVLAKGMTLIPLSLYFKNGRVKLELAVCRGKKLYDKRDDIAKRDAELEIKRQMRKSQY